MTSGTMRWTGRLVLVLAVLAGLVAMHGLAGHGPMAHGAMPDHAATLDHATVVDHAAVDAHDAVDAMGPEAAAAPDAPDVLPTPSHDCDAATCVAILLAAASVLAVAAHLLGRADAAPGRPRGPSPASRRPPRPPQLSALCVLRL